MIRFLPLLAVLIAALSPSVAGAQPYGEYPPAYRYGERPPPYYGDYRRPPPSRVGYRCDASAATPRGGRGFICPIRRPRPLGAGCECPPPPPPPGYSYGPPLPGRVIP